MTYTSKHQEGASAVSEVKLVPERSGMIPRGGGEGEQEEQVAAQVEIYSAWEEAAA